MPRIKNHKPIIIILVILLFVLSVSVFFAPDMKPVTRVKVHNKNIVISQGTTAISNTRVGMDNSSKIQNEDINSLNKEFNVNNSDVGIGNKSSKVKFNNVRGSRVKYKNADPFDDINFNSKFRSNSLPFQNTARYRREMQKYTYQNINWGTWKSRFVNRILDDSLYIPNLDTYGIGTWFYYSFVVTDTGEIHDVTVFSLYLTEEDKLLIRSLIRSYEGMPITKFPEGSKRKKAKIKAIMILGDSEQKANASSFLDSERVKVPH